MLYGFVDCTKCVAMIGKHSILDDTCNDSELSRMLEFDS